jgi:hypothetical protein
MQLVFEQDPVEPSNGKDLKVLGAQLRIEDATWENVKR